MKNRKLTLAILAMVVATVVSVAIVSCKKDSESKMPENKASEMSASDINMDEYLTSFKKRLLSAQKGEEAISPEQAERDLGNLLNFDFGDANYASDVYCYDTIHVKLPLNHGLVDLSQLSITYKDAVDQVVVVFNKTDLFEKSVYAISCSFKQDTRDDVSDGIITITTRGLSSPQPSIKTGFNQTDNWHVGNGLGKCDGTCVGDDHLTMLKLVYDNTKSALSCNGRIYFTNNGTASFNSCNFPADTQTGPIYNEGYRLWYGYPSSVNTYCVSYLEMEYYLDNLKDILDNWVFIDVNQYVTRINLRLDDYNEQSVPNPLRKVVTCEFDYATVNCTNEPIAEY